MVFVVQVSPQPEIANWSHDSSIILYRMNLPSTYNLQSSNYASNQIFGGFKSELDAVYNVKTLGSPDVGIQMI